ncbi:MAG TPA: ATP-binding cassette domain-containing protein, partial [Planctomycetota bacterium]|nr:ATP-binding cassette domain-containing protein [Planctomycetota bacterium]
MNDVTVGGQVPPLLEVRDVTRQFRMGSETLNVLRGVSFAIDEGEFVAIRGSSGSGKSTLLHVLGLLDRPNAGRVLYRGEDLTRVSESRRTKLRSTEFAFVFQFYYLLPELSAIENVLMPAMIAGRSAVLLPRGGREREERALGLLERVGPADRRKHRAH